MTIIAEISESLYEVNISQNERLKLSEMFERAFGFLIDISMINDFSKSVEVTDSSTVMESIRNMLKNGSEETALISMDMAEGINTIFFTAWCMQFENSEACKGHEASFNSIRSSVEMLIHKMNAFGKNKQ